ncbi:BTB/POZ domain-containing protein At5g03250-like [Euphorbia lathyris]|uniref:BTB/POZ domain-containing protein At5g03250-like n=1 Tax=Euphorbia lathyris TaxID=212925 RepID=UPI003313C31C
MALMRLGSKSDAFHLQGQSWVCTNGLQSDVTVEIGNMSFNLHKFPLLSRSGLLEKMIEELPMTLENSSSPVLNLDELPGGPKAFELISKFCYGIKIDLTCLNVVSLRCASEFLKMTEDYGEGNLILQTENLLNDVFSNWEDSLKALETCEEVVSYAEELRIISRLIDSLATKSCVDISSLPRSSTVSTDGIWNGISVSKVPIVSSMVDDWWFEDISCLNLSLYKQFILAIQSKGMKPETIAASLFHYSNKHLPQITDGKSSFPSEADEKILLEEIVTLLPYKKGVSSPKFLLRLLRTAMALHSSPICRENLEKRIGTELDQALLVDLLIPNIGYSAETLYDIDCVQRILDHFMSLQQETVFSPCIVEENPFVSGVAESLTPATTVASLVDGFLAEIAPDVNLKPQKFEALAATVPDYARPVDDGVYHAVDMYLKAHPWLTDMEREQLCRLMNCQKLSLEASTHAAQNERLPLRVIVQVLFFEQLRLRTSVSGWFFVSENLHNSQNPNNNLSGKDMKERVSEIEKECSAMKQDIHRLMKSKNKWKLFSKRFSFRRQKLHPCSYRKVSDFKESSINEHQDQLSNADV